MKAIERRRRPAWGYIAISFFLALLLDFLPLPAALQAWWPQWVLLAVFYWSLHLSQHWGVFTSWGVGLLEDIVSYTLLGYHAIGAALLAMVAGASNRRLNLFNPVEQIIVVFFLMLLPLAIRLWADKMTGQPVNLDLWKSALSSALIWPVFALTLTQLDPQTRRFRKN